MHHFFIASKTGLHLLQNYSKLSTSASRQFGHFLCTHVAQIYRFSRFMYIFLHTLQNTLLLLSCLTILKSCEVFHQWWQLFLVDAVRAVGLSTESARWTLILLINTCTRNARMIPPALLELDLPQQWVLRAWACPPGSRELYRQRWHDCLGVCPPGSQDLPQQWQHEGFGVSLPGLQDLPREWWDEALGVSRPGSQDLLQWWQHEGFGAYQLIDEQMNRGAKCEISYGLSE